jgi:hypothetical protein
MVSYTIALSVLASALIPSAAFASSKGRKNTTILLGAAAAHQLLTGKTTNGILLGAGTAYAYKRYRDSRKSEKRRARAASIYRSRRYARARR